MLEFIFKTDYYKGNYYFFGGVKKLMERLFNFSAGPAALPLSVLEEAQRDLLCYPGAGCSVMEMSHRSRPYEEIIEETEATLRRIMNIPDDYAVVFCQGGATMQFSMAAMNYARQGQKAAHAVNGVFSKKAFEEASRWCDAYKITDTKTSVPEITEDMILPGTAYLHITGNNTTSGTMYRKLPEHGNTPLIGDWTSGILGTEIDVRDYSLVYAGAQKNMGPAGVAVAIFKRGSVLPDIDPVVPSLLRYETMDKTDSMLNTPPTFAIYMCGLVYKWVEEQGGVSELQKLNEKKSQILYDVIDSSKLYKGIAEKNCRSIMNVTFTLPDEENTNAFLEMAKKRGMISLAGYRSVGGIRASIYNGMPIEGVECLAECMVDFEKGYRE